MKNAIFDVMPRRIEPNPPADGIHAASPLQGDQRMSYREKGRQGRMKVSGGERG